MQKQNKKQKNQNHNNSDYIAYKKLKKKNANLKYQNAIIQENKNRKNDYIWEIDNKNVQLKFKGSNN